MDALAKLGPFDPVTRAAKAREIIKLDLSKHARKIAMTRRIARKRRKKHSLSPPRAPRKNKRTRISPRKYRFRAHVQLPPECVTRVQKVKIAMLSVLDELCRRDSKDFVFRLSNQQKPRDDGFFDFPQDGKLDDDEELNMDEADVDALLDMEVDDEDEARRDEPSAVAR